MTRFLPLGPRMKDHTGERYGRLVALGFIELAAKRQHNKWLFQCDCGKEHAAIFASVQAGRIRSCGCFRVESAIENATKHGLLYEHLDVYNIWCHMRSRCLDPMNASFSDYGGRGIAVCERWGDFAAFLADMGPRPAGMSIDRKDNNGNYESGNCRWASGEEQANNKRNNKLIELNGDVKTLAQWCREFHVGYGTALYRLKIGMTPQAALSRADYRDGFFRSGGGKSI